MIFETRWTCDNDNNKYPKSYFYTSTYMPDRKNIWEIISRNINSENSQIGAILRGSDNSEPYLYIKNKFQYKTNNRSHFCSKSIKYDMECLRKLAHVRETEIYKLIRSMHYKLENKHRKYKYIPREDRAQIVKSYRIKK
jgi:hypothetical protein